MHMRLTHHLILLCVEAYILRTLLATDAQSFGSSLSSLAHDFRRLLNRGWLGGVDLLHAVSAACSLHSGQLVLTHRCTPMRAVRPACRLHGCIGS